MDIRRFFVVVGMLAALAMLIPVTHAMAGASIEPPPEGAVISGPELWGVVVVFCHPGLQDFAVVRVKRIVGCNAEMQALVDPQWVDLIGCADNGDAYVEQSLPPGTTFFNIPGTAFINKVKHFKTDINPVTGGTVVSFEAQFKFWTMPEQ